MLKQVRSDLSIDIGSAIWLKLRMQDAPKLGLLEHFKDLADPRVIGRCDHQLLDVMVIALSADCWRSPLVSSTTIPPRETLEAAFPVGPARSRRNGSGERVSRPTRSILEVAGPAPHSADRFTRSLSPMKFSQSNGSVGPAL